MALRSKPISIATVQNGSGKPVYRVTGTLFPGGKQQKLITPDYQEAEAQRQAWEDIRLRAGSANRPKQTYLTLDQLRQSEAAWEMLKKAGLDIIEAVQLGINARAAAQKTAQKPELTFKQLWDGFLPERKKHVSEAQYDTLRIRGISFGEFVGWDTLISKITWDVVTAWLEKRDLPSKKSWNNYRGDISTVFAWAMAEPRKWLESNPVGGVTRYKKRALPKRTPMRMEIKACEDMMSYLENNRPEWCTYYALTLFAGIRPDVRNGEMWELSRCVGKNGLSPYFADEKIHLHSEITKEGTSRTVSIKKNLAAWLKKYPPTPESLCPMDYKDSAHIRERFGIPHDGLRHTAISAYISNGGNYAEACEEFGNSEPIIKSNYLSRMKKSEAMAFYSIMPSTGSV